VFDFLSRQVMNLAALPRQVGYEGLLGAARRTAEHEAPRAVVARPAVAEDQVLLAGGTAPPLPALPVKPAEPVEAGYRIRDLLRRLRDKHRRSSSRSSPTSDVPAVDADDEQHAGQRFDRWA
jgi:hypothetical protein